MLDWGILGELHAGKGANLGSVQGVCNVAQFRTLVELGMYSWTAAGDAAAAEGVQCPRTIALQGPGWLCTIAPGVWGHSGWSGDMWRLMTGPGHAVALCAHAAGVALWL